MANISKKLNKVLPASAAKVLKAVGRAADQEGRNVYLVGGMVRDILLGIGHLDFDFTVEGDAIAFAKLLVRRFKGRAVTYKDFGTATIFAKGGLRMDFSTARREKYLRPGALPKVSFGRIRDDMYRRDFTINAMAVSLNKSRFGEVADFYGGVDDLRAGKIRVLHNLSFIDDATRIFRAVRFEARYGFRMDGETEGLLKKAINRNIFSTISRERFRNEIVYLLSESDTLRPLERLHGLNLLKFIHPAIRFSPKTKRAVNNIRRNISWYERSFKHNGLSRWLVYLMALTDSLSLAELRRLSARLAMSNKESEELVSVKRAGPEVKRLVSSKSRLRPSAVCRALKGLSPEGLIFIISLYDNKAARLRISQYLSKYRKVKLCISGEDLRKKGFRPGPAFKRALEDVLYAKLDGKIKGKKEELSFAIRHLKNY